MHVALVIFYNALSQCAEAMQPDLSNDQRWYRVAQAHYFLGQMRGIVEGEIIGGKVASIARSKSRTDAMHREHREMKKEVFAWLDENMKRFSSMDSAAWEIAGKVAPIVFRTARDWVGEWKKQQSLDAK